MMTKAEWQSINGQRAEVYQWLGSLIAIEQTDEQLKHYEGTSLQSLYQLLAQLGLSEEVDRFTHAITALMKDETPALELSADFAEHFLLDEKVSALPYASVYLEDGKLYGDIETAMSEFLADNALSISGNFKEPSDHLAVYLYLMAHWIHRAQDYENMVSISSDQVTFLRNGLMAWLPKFVEASQKQSLKYDFYPALTALLQAFIEVDIEFLNEF